MDMTLSVTPGNLSSDPDYVEVLEQLSSLRGRVAELESALASAGAELSTVRNRSLRLHPSDDDGDHVLFDRDGAVTRDEGYRGFAYVTRDELGAFLDGCGLEPCDEKRGAYWMHPGLVLSLQVNSAGSRLAAEPLRELKVPLPMKWGSDGIADGRSAYVEFEVVEMGGPSVTRCYWRTYVCSAVLDDKVWFRAPELMYRYEVVWDNGDSPTFVPGSSSRPCVFVHGSIDVADPLPESAPEPDPAPDGTYPFRFADDVAGYMTATKAGNSVRLQSGGYIERDDHDAFSDGYVLGSVPAGCSPNRSVSFTCDGCDESGDVVEQGAVEVVIGADGTTTVMDVPSGSVYMLDIDCTYTLQ